MMMWAGSSLKTEVTYYMSTQHRILEDCNLINSVVTTLNPKLRRQSIWEGTEALHDSYCRSILYWKVRSMVPHWHDFCFCQSGQLPSIL